MITELKKIEQKIKKEEKEEKNLRKLIYADSSLTLPPYQASVKQDVEVSN
jgi:hypothetical protein